MKQLNLKNSSIRRESMENGVFSSGHPTVIYHRGQPLFLFKGDKEQLTRITPTVVIALDQLPIPDEERGSPIRSVEWLLREGYLLPDGMVSTTALLYSGDLLFLERRAGLAPTGLIPTWAGLLEDEGLIAAKFPSLTEDLTEERPCQPPKSPDPILLDSNPFARYRYSGSLEAFPLAPRRMITDLE